MFNNNDSYSLCINETSSGGHLVCFYDDFNISNIQAHCKFKLISSCKHTGLFGIGYVFSQSSEYEYFFISSNNSLIITRVVDGSSINIYSVTINLNKWYDLDILIDNDKNVKIYLDKVLLLQEYVWVSNFTKINMFQLGHHYYPDENSIVYFDDVLLIFNNSTLYPTESGYYYMQKQLSIYEVFSDKNDNIYGI